MTLDNGLPQEIHENTRPAATAALVALLISVVGIPAFGLITPWLGGTGLFDSLVARMMTTLLYQALLFVLPAAIYYGRRPAMRPAIRARRFDPLCAVLILFSAVIGMLALNQLSVLWTLILESFGLIINSGNDIAPRTPQELWLMLLVAAVAPAFFEELLFRGFLLPALEPMGKRRAVLLSGVMFAMLHGRIEALPVHLLLGILLAALVLKTGSLFAAVLFHGAYNGILLLASYMLAQTNPASLDTMPTLAQSVQNLPLTISLLAVWGLLTYTAMQRGSKMKKNPLPSATRAPLTTSAKVLLVITFILLIAIEVVAFIGMLPGAGA